MPWRRMRLRNAEVLARCDASGELVSKEGRVEVGLPVALFPGVIADPIRDHYAVTADGQRFLVPVTAGGDAEARLHVVTNWTSLSK